MQTVFLHLHQTLYMRTDGRFGHRLIGVPSLILRTTGRSHFSPRRSAVHSPVGVHPGDPGRR